MTPLLIQKSSATGIRLATNRALSLLVPTDHQTIPDADEEVELHLSFSEYDALYRSGVLSRQQMRAGCCKRSDFARVRSFLQDNMSSAERAAFDRNHELTTEAMPDSIDCGLKRVDSKRYKRDYQVNRDNGKQHSKPKWQVQLSSETAAASTEVVPHTPAGQREDPRQELMNETEDQVGLERGFIYRL